MVSCRECLGECSSVAVAKSQLVFVVSRLTFVIQGVILFPADNVGCGIILFQSLDCEMTSFEGNYAF